MTAIADVRKGQTCMSFKGEHQARTKQWLRHHVCPGVICRATISESTMTILVSRDRSNCGVTDYGYRLRTANYF